MVDPDPRSKDLSHADVLIIRLSLMLYQCEASSIVRLLISFYYCMKDSLK